MEIMKKYLILMVALFAMVSCTKQEVYEHETTSVITIYLNSQTIIRSAAKSSLPTRSALVSDPKAVENNVNSVTIAVFKSDGNGPMQAKDTYYPIVVDKNMLPNKNYMLNVTIKGVGVDSPTDDLNYSNLTVTLNVNNFDDISKDISLD